MARRTGEVGENVACRWLMSRGYRILTRNFHARRGELDIVAQKDSVIAFVEVKTRTGGETGQGACSVGAAKQFHLRKAAEAWLAVNRWAENMWIRFDVVEVCLSEHSARILYIPGAF